MYKVHEIKGHIQTIYIIEYIDKILLADCATRADLDKIEQFVTQQLVRKMKDIKLAVVSHMHPDHAGLANVLQRKYKIPILAHPFANKWYAGFFGKLQHFIDVLLAWYVSIKMKNPPRRMWFPAGLKPDYITKNGESIPFFDDWRIIYTPGHTSHDISLYHKETGTIYLGDTILKIKDKFLLPMPVTLPQLMEKTLDVLAGMELKKIMLAHSGVTILEDNSVFFEDFKKQLNKKKNGIFAFINFISFFPPCIRNIDDC